METEFYQSTWRWDATYTRQRQDALGKLTPILKRWLEQYDKERAGWRVIPSMMGVVAAESDGASIELTLEIAAEPTSNTTREDGLDVVSARIYRTLWTLQPHDNSPVDVLQFRATGVPNVLASQLPVALHHTDYADWGYGLKGVVARTAPGQTAEDDATLIGNIELDMPVVDSLRRFRMASEGLTVPASGGYWRFLYFSVVVITTLGFGDIVPLTDRARLWVAGESIGGVIIIGLFLNSLGARAGTRTSRRTHRRTRPLQPTPTRAV